jgi:Domain of unknown function (DUF4145)
MAQIFLDCPHCDALSVSMNLIGRSLTHDMQGVAFAQCNNCALPVTAIIRLYGITPQIWVIHQEGDIIDKKEVQIIRVFPKRAITAAPEHIDADVAKIFVQSENARKRGDRHVAGMGFRKTLDIALKLFDVTVKGDLYSRIDILAGRHDITPAMKSWAHQVRLIGNDAAHEADEPSSEDIDAMAAFTETLLKYLFTLPAEVKARATP